MLNKGRGAENTSKKRSPCKLIDSCTMYPAVATSTTNAYIQLAYSDVSWAVGWPWPWWSLTTVFSSGTKLGRKLAKRRHITCALETTEYVGKHLQRWWCRVLEGPSFAVDIQVKLGSILPTFFRGMPVRCDALAVYFLPLG